jgi:hypothetical protein
MDVTRRGGFFMLRNLGSASSSFRVVSILSLSWPWLGRCDRKRHAWMDSEPGWCWTVNFTYENWNCTLHTWTGMESQGFVGWMGFQTSPCLALVLPEIRLVGMKVKITVCGTGEVYLWLCKERPWHCGKSLWTCYTMLSWKECLPIPASILHWASLWLEKLRKNRICSARLRH